MLSNGARTCRSSVSGNFGSAASCRLASGFHLAKSAAMQTSCLPRFFIFGSEFPNTVLVSDEQSVSWLSDRLEFLTILTHIFAKLSVFVNESISLCAFVSYIFRAPEAYIKYNRYRCSEHLVD
jgi:hypothetical protein